MNQPPEGYFAQIGNYYVGDTIGRGTFGKVKMGLHIFTMQNVAIKILDKDKIVDESDKVRVAREIQILRRIRHPNIIQLFEIIESQTQLFLITEYAPNSELFNYIVKRNRLNERQCARFLLQIFGAVEYLHENYIVHRDLKPENLLLDYTDSIKVVDFGLSNMYTEGETLSTACGSPCYAAPEMVSGRRYEGLKTDIWSCGIVLYAMICGFLPFEDQNTPNLYKKIINDPLKLPPFLSETAQSFLLGILHKDPHQRMTIDEMRAHDFCTKNSNQPILRGITYGKDDILVDPLILSLIRDNFDVDIDAAKVMIQNNKHNQITATYYLLLNNHIQKGGVSVADLSRPPTKKKTTTATKPAITTTSPSPPAVVAAPIATTTTTKPTSTTNNKTRIQDFEDIPTSPVILNTPLKSPAKASSPKRPDKPIGDNVIEQSQAGFESPIKSSAAGTGTTAAAAASVVTATTILGIPTTTSLSTGTQPNSATKPEQALHTIKQILKETNEPVNQFTSNSLVQNMVPAAADSTKQQTEKKNPSEDAILVISNTNSAATKSTSSSSTRNDTRLDLRLIQTTSQQQQQQQNQQPTTVESKQQTSNSNTNNNNNEAVIRSEDNKPVSLITPANNAAAVAAAPSPTKYKIPVRKINRMSMDSFPLSRNNQTSDSHIPPTIIAAASATSNQIMLKNNQNNPIKNISVSNAINSGHYETLGAAPSPQSQQSKQIAATVISNTENLGVSRNTNFNSVNPTQTPNTTSHKPVKSSINLEDHHNNNTSHHYPHHQYQHQQQYHHPLHSSMIESTTTTTHNNNNSSNLPMLHQQNGQRQSSVGSTKNSSTSTNSNGRNFANMISAITSTSAQTIPRYSIESSSKRITTSSAIAAAAAAAAAAATAGSSTQGGVTQDPLKTNVSSKRRVITQDGSIINQTIESAIQLQNTNNNNNHINSNHGNSVVINTNQNASINLTQKSTSTAGGASNTSTTTTQIGGIPNSTAVQNILLKIHQKTKSSENFSGYNLPRRFLGNAAQLRAPVSPVGNILINSSTTTFEQQEMNQNHRQEGQTSHNLLNQTTNSKQQQQQQSVYRNIRSPGISSNSTNGAAQHSNNSCQIPQNSSLEQLNGQPILWKSSISHNPNSQFQQSAFFANNPNANQSILTSHANNIMNLSMPESQILSLVKQNSATTGAVSTLGKTLNSEQLQFSQYSHEEASSVRKKLRQIGQRSLGGGGGQSVTSIRSNHLLAQQPPAVQHLIAATASGSGTNSASSSVLHSSNQIKMRIRKENTPESHTTDKAISPTNINSSNLLASSFRRSNINSANNTNNNNNNSYTLTTQSQNPNHSQQFQQQNLQQASTMSPHKQVQLQQTQQQQSQQHTRVNSGTRRLVGSGRDLATPTTQSSTVAAAAAAAVSSHSSTVLPTQDQSMSIIQRMHYMHERNFVAEVPVASGAHAFTSVVNDSKRTKTEGSQSHYPQQKDKSMITESKIQTRNTIESPLFFKKTSINSQSGVANSSAIGATSLIAGGGSSIGSSNSSGSNSSNQIIGSKYYLGLKQHMIAKEPLTCSFGEGIRNPSTLSQATATATAAVTSSTPTESGTSSEHNEINNNHSRGLSLNSATNNNNNNNNIQGTHHPSNNYYYNNNNNNFSLGNTINNNSINGTSSIKQSYLSNSHGPSNANVSSSSTSATQLQQTQQQQQQQQQQPHHRAGTLATSALISELLLSGPGDRYKFGNTLSQSTGPSQLQQQQQSATATTYQPSGQSIGSQHFGQNSISSYANIQKYAVKKSAKQNSISSNVVQNISPFNASRKQTH